MASWEERLDQLEQNFLAEVERLKEDILGQLNVNTDKYYTIDNEVTTSFTSSLAVPSACWTTPSLTKIEKGDEHAAATAVETPKGPIDGECSTSNNNVEPPSVTPPDPPVEDVVVPPTVEESPPPPSTPPAAELPAAVSSTLSPPQVGRSRRATPARQAEAHVVRVRVAYKFESQEEDELPLAKGLELIAFMREDESWWWGQRPDGKVGIFPSNFVTVLAGDPAALPIREDDDDEAGEQQEELQEEGDAVHPPLQQSSPSEHATAAGPPSVVAEAEAETPPTSSQRRPPPPPSARLKPTTLLGPTAAASAADGTQGAASDASNPAVSPTTSTSTTPKKPAVPQPSLKPTQRGEAAKKDWHEKRRSILLLQEQSRTTRLLAQWEKAGAGLSFAPPPAQ